jgi:diguanylate cyclase
MVHDFLSSRKAEENGASDRGGGGADNAEADRGASEEPSGPVQLGPIGGPARAPAAPEPIREATDRDLELAEIGEPSPDQILMDRIGAFLILNELEITAANLARALGIFSGQHPDFAALTAEMEVRGEPITQQWLDTLACECACDKQEQDRAEVDRLAATLQNSIEAFASTTRDARCAAADYREAMDDHAQEAETIVSGEAAEELLSRVSELTRAIREQAQQSEEKMQRSEREAISLRRDLEEAQRVANIDHLTGLPNRRALDEMLERLWGEARDVDWDGSDAPDREPVAIAFCDIDNFKPVNDIHGHDTGDRVLQMVARTLSQGAGEDCQVVRYGGEEFVIVYRGLSLEAARDNLDAIRATLAKRPFVNRTTRESLGTITFSGGIADLFAFVDRNSALRAADEALYRAKNNGRNRIELAAPPSD